jgi:XTP/dITP diphosphohydrolase
LTLYCATTNPGKLREFRLAAERFSRGAISIVPLPGLLDIPPVAEAGATFEENAARKAIYYSVYATGPLFADDSGLEVTALGGAPGVLSARFAGAGASDEDNNRLLIERLRGAEDRSGRFVCVIAVAESGRLLHTFRGAVDGRITEEPRGPNGFGYDPLFFYPPFGCTFGELSGDRKLEVSHRGTTLAAMLEWFSGRQSA